ncbi:MAG: hypothetical protein ACFB8W_22030 [Elainellaceae cyanobacterium]
MTTESTPQDHAAWQTQASFLLEFQTRAVDESLEEQTYIVFQENEEQRTFPGLCGEPAQNWMLERYRSSSHEPSSSAEAAATASAESEAEPEPASPAETDTSLPDASQSNQAEAAQPDESPSDESQAGEAQAGEAQAGEAQAEDAQPEASPSEESQSATAATEETADSSSQAEVLLTLKVLKVRLFQPPKSARPIVISNGIYSTPSPLLAKKLFDLEIFFELPELARMSLPDRVSYSLDGFAKSIDSPGLSLPLGSSQPSPLEDYRSHYQTTLTQISLPSGLYRVQLLINFIGAPIPFGFYDIPRFQVVQ